MAYPYVYQIQFMPEHDEGNYKVRKESGIVYADTYADAVEKLTEYYGEESICSFCEITAMDDTPILLPRAVCDKILNDSYVGEYDD